MINYSRLSEPEYLNETLEGIKSLNRHEVEELLRELAYKLHYNTLDDVDAKIVEKVLSQAKDRLDSFSNKRNNNDDNDGGIEKGRSISMHPNGSHRTSVSNHYGTVSIVFLVVNVALIAAMYTLLVIANFFD